MADVIEIPAGNKAVKLPVADNDFGKVHIFSVPLKTGDASNVAVTLLETETAPTVVAHIRPGHQVRLAMGAKTFYARAAAASGLIVSVEQPAVAPQPTA